MSLGESIESAIRQLLKPEHLEVINESHMHTRGLDTHFKVIVVAEKFNGLTSVKRQQAVYAAVKPLFNQGLHALSQSTFTPAEWAAAGNALVNESPECAHASGGRTVIPPRPKICKN